MIFSATLSDSSFSKGPQELPPFLGNILHESSLLRRMEENLNYTAKRIREIGATATVGTRWYKASQQAEWLEGKPEMLAEVLYGGRFGNINPGDGWKYRGRGPGQVTFHDNYAAVGDIVGQDLLNMPDLVAAPHFCIGIFLAWWEDKVPDSVIGNDMLVRRVVNGGKMGLAEVEQLTELARVKLAEMGL